MAKSREEHGRMLKIADEILAYVLSVERTDTMKLSVALQYDMNELYDALQYIVDENTMFLTVMPWKRGKFVSASNRPKITEFLEKGGFSASYKTSQEKIQAEQDRQQLELNKLQLEILELQDAPDERRKTRKESRAAILIALGALLLSLYQACSKK